MFICRPTENYPHTFCVAGGGWNAAPTMNAFD